MESDLQHIQKEGENNAVDYVYGTADFMAPRNSFQLHSGRFYSHFTAYRFGRSRPSVNQRKQNSVKLLGAEVCAELLAEVLVPGQAAPVLRRILWQDEILLLSPAQQALPRN